MMLSTIIAKLKANLGESISETLVAVLIASFALIMLAGAITTSVRIVKDSKNQIGEYYDADKFLVEHNSSGVSRISTGSLDVTAATSISGIGSVSERLPGSYYANNTFSKYPVVNYSVSVSSTSTSGGG